MIDIHLLSLITHFQVGWNSIPCVAKPDVRWSLYSHYVSRLGTSFVGYDEIVIG